LGGQFAILGAKCSSIYLLIYPGINVLAFISNFGANLQPKNAQSWPQELAPKSWPQELAPKSWPQKTIVLDPTFGSFTLLKPVSH